jgi:hypothetical protein
MPIFFVAIVFDTAAALLALFVLKPLRVRVMSSGGVAARVPKPAAAS